MYNRVYRIDVDGIWSKAVTNRDWPSAVDCDGAIVHHYHHIKISSTAQKSIHPSI